jgi:hypothetical protein
MIKHVVVIALVTLFSATSFADECKNKCNKKCDDANNKSKCVAECRRACDGK